MLDLRIPEKLGPLLTKHKRFKIIEGGRGGAKSMSVGDIFLMKARQEACKVGCFREYQSSIEDSVHALLADEIRRTGFSDYSVYNNSIRDDLNGGEFKFSGLARNPESVKSKHGFKYFWVEEAQTISYKSLELITPTLRETDAECWFTLNRGSSADPIYQRFIKKAEKELAEDGYYEDAECLIIRINYPDNPWFPEGLELERQSDAKRLKTAEYRHKWLGECNDYVDNAIIPMEWFDAAIDAHVRLGFKPSGAIVASHDPSDEGDDPKGWALRKGSIFYEIDYKDDCDVNDGCTWATQKAINARADVFTWDCDGLGAALKLQVAQALKGKNCDWRMFKGSETADRPEATYLPVDDDYIPEKHRKEKKKSNRDTFRNKRAQHYWYLRDRFYNTYRAVHKGEYVDPDTMISLSSKIPKLDEIRSEVCRIPKKKNGNGKIQILSKEEMRKLEIPSPNMADSMMMSLFTPKAKKQVEVKDVPMVNYYNK